MKIMHDSADSAQNHMDKDLYLLQNITSLEGPLLRFYEWESPSATYGYFINPGDYLDLASVKSRGLQLARRPTGGGIIFHLTDLAFSILVPATHEAYSTNTLRNYAYINGLVTQALIRFNKNLETSLLPVEQQPYDPNCNHFCMAKPTIYDIMVGGKKVGGAAQRRTHDGFLHQGSISLGLPDEGFLKDVLKADTQVLEAMKANSYALDLEGKDLEGARAQLRASFSEGAAEGTAEGATKGTAEGTQKI